MTNSDFVIVRIMRWRYFYNTYEIKVHACITVVGFGIKLIDHYSFAITSSEVRFDEVITYNRKLTITERVFDESSV